jgi:hypothetical protein
MKASNCCLIYTGRPRALHGVVCVLELVLERSQLASVCGFAAGRSPLRALELSAHSRICGFAAGRSPLRALELPARSRVCGFAAGRSRTRGSGYSRDRSGHGSLWLDKHGIPVLAARNGDGEAKESTGRSRERPVLSGTEVPVSFRMGSALRLSDRCATTFR